jgi:hypothetical protein
LAPCDFFLSPKMKLKLKGRRFDTTEEIQAESQSAWHSYKTGLPVSVPKMETVGPVSTCGMELLRGRWRPIGLMVRFMIFTASVRNNLNTTTTFWTIRIYLTFQIHACMRCPVPLTKKFVLFTSYSKIWGTRMLDTYKHCSLRVTYYRQAKYCL